MIGLARWLRNEERLEEALALMRRAVNRRIAEPLLYETLWHIAEMERKLGRDDAALAVYTEISTTTNAYRGKAYERLAIHYEHKEKNALMALEMTQAALRISDSENLRKRAGRLLKKASTPKSGRLL
jgi:tetratricopeptide (TPR) repeat protein